MSPPRGLFRVSPPAYDARSGWRWFGATILVTLITAISFLRHDHQILLTLGDTDDAMRLVLARDLVNGRGWYDQWIGRLQPPVGTYMHWSRLLDGALAAAIRLARLGLSPSQAERAVRVWWPLSWIPVAAGASLAIARGLGGPKALLAGMILLIANPWAFVQFQPGRIDHHNVQISLTLAAAALAITARHRIWAAALAGAVSALTLAIGIEALAFHALIGAGLALAWWMDAGAAKAARAYGLALALTALGFFLAQTPPWRWSLSVCDALGCNLTVALVLAGVGLAIVSSLTLGRPVAACCLLAVGGLAAGAYLALDPACLHGPLAAVDPRLRPFWFDGIEELKPWPALLATDRNAAIRLASVGVLGLAGAGVLIVRAMRRLEAPLLIAVACVVVAIVATFQALRLEDYLFGFSLPVIAAAVAALASARGLAVLIAASLAASPASLAAAARMTVARLAPGAPVPASPNARCYDTDVYRPLAALPQGLVLADINLGPFILAHTPHSALAAPYHRMSFGVLAAHQALGAAPDKAQAQVRALGVRYIVECGALMRVGPGSVEAAIRSGQIPPWLRRRSGPGAVLQIYEVVSGKEP